MTLLQEVLDATRSGPHAVNAWVDGHRDRVDHALAAQVYGQASDSLKAGRLHDGMALYFTAMVLYRVTGPEERALRSAFNYSQCVYMAADTVPAYETVRQQLLTIATRARDGGYVETAFDGFVVAADSAFCAAELSQGATDWVLHSLADLREAAGAISSPLQPAQLQMYTNVAANVWVLARQAEWGPNGGAAEKLLTALAADSERLVPVGYTIPSDPQKSAFVAVRLAELSDEYGNPNTAGARRAALA
jgi:hypothetical protein